MISGSCCCGAIRFELSAEPSMMGMCHCSRCRKLGAGALIFIERRSLVWVQGREQVRVFEPTSPYRYRRCFCGVCGSSLGEILSEDESFPISAHLLDDDITQRIRFHEFVSEKPDWLEICDDAQRFDGHPETS